MPRKGSLTRRSAAAQLATQDNRVVAYVRVSTEKQVNSIDAQQMRQAEFASARSILIDSTFADPGVSATKTDFLKRAGARQMLAHMRRRSISTILMLRVDRVFRSMRDFHLTATVLEKAGIFLRFIEPDLDYSTPIGRMFLQQLVMLAELEGSIRGERQDDAFESMRARRIARTANAIPYGWQPAGTAAAISRTTNQPKVALAPHPAEQTVLRHLMDIYRQDTSYGVWTRLAREANRLCIPTKKAGLTIRRRGRTIPCSGTWAPATIQSVLEHAVFATDLELPHPPSLHDAIQTLRQAHSAAAAAA